MVAAANVNDTKLLEATIDAIVLARPEPQECEQHLCLDKGYDNPTGHAAIVNGEYIPHLRRIGEPDAPPRAGRRRRTRRWVVERTPSWLNKCRAILVRYAKKSSNYLGLIQLACILLWFRRLHRLRVLG